MNDAGLSYMCEVGFSIEREEIGMEQWLSLIQEIGFPIFVSFYLLHRLETKLVAIHDVLISMKIE